MSRELLVILNLCSAAGRRSHFKYSGLDILKPINGDIAFNCLSTTMECSYQGFNGKTASQDDYREISKRLAARIQLHCLQEQGAQLTH